MSHATTTSAGPRQWAGLAVLTLAVTLLAVDGTVLALAVPSLSESLQPSATQLLWIGDIYSFALAGLLITMGNVADRFGRKRLLLIGAAGFGISSVFAAFATTPDMLILARAILGISGATIMPSTLSLIRTLFANPRQRTRAIAIWSAGATGGAALGPLVGGALLEHFWWGAVFLINIPVMVIILIAGPFLLSEARNPARAPIDLSSAALSFLTIVPVVFAIKTVAKEGLTIPFFIGLAIGVASGVLFVRRQRRLTHPLIDVRLFSNRAFSGAIVANSVAIFALSGMLFFFSQYLQLVRGFSPLVAGLAELPATAAAVLAVFVVAVLVSRLGRGAAVALALFVTSIGMAGLAVAEGLPDYFWLGLSLLLVGAGISIAGTIAVEIVVSVVPKERAGAASSISETGYELGIALGIAVLGSLLNAVYRTTVEIPAELRERFGAGLTDSLATTMALLGGDHPEVIASAQHAFTGAMQTTAIVAAILVAVAALIAWRVLPSSKGQLEEIQH